jgi:hypothetical protein
MRISPKLKSERKKTNIGIAAKIRARKARESGTPKPRPWETTRSRYDIPRGRCADIAVAMLLMR